MGKKHLENHAKCWWCGESANSREHRAKVTDIGGQFGPAPYYKNRTLVSIREDRDRETHGSNSNLFKFRATMCSRCNGHKSQPFDDAWRAFIEHSLANEYQILERQEIDLRDVFGEHWEASALDLGRYFAKHMACAISERDDTAVPRELVEFLDGGSWPEELNLTMAIDTSALYLIRWVRADPIEDSPEAGFMVIATTHSQKNQVSGLVTEIGGRYQVAWLCVFWEFLPPEKVPTSRELSPVVRLGSGHISFPEPLDHEGLRIGAEAAESGQPISESEAREIAVSYLESES